MSESGEARNHETEVDAVAFELEGGLGGKRDWKIKGNSHAAARAAIAALDALRRSPTAEDAVRLAYEDGVRAGREGHGA